VRAIATGPDRDAHDGKVRASDLATATPVDLRPKAPLFAPPASPQRRLCRDLNGVVHAIG